MCQGVKGSNVKFSLTVKLWAGQLVERRRGSRWNLRRSGSRGLNRDRSRIDRQWYRRKSLLNIRRYSYWQPVEMFLRATYTLLEYTSYFLLHLNRREIQMWLGALVCHWSCIISAMIIDRRRNDSATCLRISRIYRKKKNEREKERERYISSFSKLRALLCNRHFACFTFSLMAAFTYC